MAEEPKEPRKSFTVDEAESLLPDIQRYARGLQDIHRKLETKAAHLGELEEAGDANPAEIALQHAQFQFLGDGLAEWSAKIEETGAVLKGIDPVLVDFPAQVDGADVFLCWKQGEDHIAHYHSTTDGFSGRRPLRRSAPRR